MLFLGVAVMLTWNKISAALLGFTAFSIWYAMLMELYLFSKRPFNLLEKMLVPIGLCSYSIYLWHQPLLGRVLYWLHKCGLPESAVADFAMLPLVVAVIITLGFLSYKLIELPGINFGRRNKGALPR
jgi:peptidoglycan/LPS O-acetylase OafA/YrhL